ncbi:L-fucose-proton symporter [Dyadobacter sp. CECT 9275]|uniref:L-fucose-proton symporter n=1 Tax=Dyadobacter helix TaxID=2822344 RepID=A0A916N7W4_9BACT|nr:sugar MFS transporter [Dyadobacter sp. CECT 9275]CAG5018683.1 L-fucose-proton symporter [Dyadobacter sp. CECT 9275]
MEMTRPKTYIYPLVIIAILFFVFGFITWVNGILIPYFQICLELSTFQSLFVAFASYIAYFFMAIPSAWILQHTGYKKGMVIGLVVMAIGTFMFLPAAYSRTYLVFLGGLFVTGTGLALLQTAANPYVAIIGPAESTAQRIGFMGIANKTAGILSQRILGAIFLLNADSIVESISAATNVERAAILDEYILKVVNPYLVITLILLALAVLVWLSKLPEIDEHADQSVSADSGTDDRTSVFQYPYLVLGVLALFMSAACEVIPIDGIIVYSRALGIPLNEARHFAEYALYAMLVGYVSSTILIPRWLSQQAALMYCAIGGIVMVTASYFTSGLISVYCLICTGFGSALLWGTIWGLAIRNLKRFTKIGSALLLMSVIGGGIFPLIFGTLIDYNPGWPQTSVLVLIPCYLFLFYYAVWGYRLGRWKTVIPAETTV